MAHHGSVAQQTATPLPRVHRPTAAAATTAATAARADPEVVTLTSPRPDGERVANEYVETPFRSPCEAIESHHQALHLPIVKYGRRPVATGGVIRKQPGAATTFKKDHRGSSSVTSAARGPPLPRPSPGGCYSGSIICPVCGRCRCDACRQPRPLPSRWLCHNACFCSPEAAVDYASCLCCVKALFYHCSKDYELERDGDSASCADSPCSCAPHRRWSRWGCLAALSALLPCLWCYWPLRGCVRACEACYERHSCHGCRCQPHPPTTNPPPPSPPHRAAALDASSSSDLTSEKRLLDASLEF